MDLDENGNIIARYVQNPNVLDEPISIETSTGTFYYLFDGLGSVTGLTDSGGNLVATYKYDAFGNIVSETGDATLNAINPYRFTSRVYDKESGLYYYRARYYDSSVGRFISKDPLRSELREGKNLYVYVGNNPVNYKDPRGTWCIGLSAAMASAYLAYTTSGVMGHTQGWRAHFFVGCNMHRLGCGYWQTYYWAFMFEFTTLTLIYAFNPSINDISAALWGWKKYDYGGCTYWWWIRTGYKKSCATIAAHFFEKDEGSPLLDLNTFP